MTDSDATVVTEPGEPEGTTGLQIAETKNATGHEVVVLSNTHDIEGVETGRDVFVRRDELDEVLDELLRIAGVWDSLQVHVVQAPSARVIGVYKDYGDAWDAAREYEDDNDSGRARVWNKRLKMGPPEVSR